MSAPVQLACSSHPPLLMIRPREPVEEAALVVQRQALRTAIEAFDPEQIVCFGNNHFAGFHYAVMPPFCVGLEARAVPDLGGFAGPLKVDRPAALALLQATRDAGFDAAVSYRMQVDHAFSQPLMLLTGALDRYPVIPVFVSVFTPPFLRFARTRQFGAAVGRHLAASGRRTLFLGTGGLSHHPVRYFPLMDDAPPEVLAWQMDGARSEGLDEEAWFQRFSALHIEGAEMAADGRRTARDMRLNPELDRQVLAALQAGRPEVLDDWRNEDLVRDAGVGSLEVHTWVAATAAYQAAGGRAPLLAHYAPVVEYGTAFGMMWSA